jgi:hypothetical protein
VHGISYPFHPAFSRGREDKVGNDLSICRGVKGIAVVTEFLAQVFGINDISIMGYSQGVFA